MESQNESDMAPLDNNIGPTQPSEENASSPKWLESDITKKEEWHSFYEKTFEGSYYLSLFIDQHYGAWGKLCETCNLTENETESLFLCLKNMIETIPAGTNYEENNLVYYINNLYKWKRNGKLTDEQFNELFQVLRKKLALTYTKPSAFWKNVMLNENLGLEPENKLYIDNCLKVYKKQFSCAYIRSNRDFKQFKVFCKKHAVEPSEQEEIVSLYNSIKEESSYLSDNYLALFDDTNHHIQFEGWIFKLLEKNHLEKAIALCEETVCDEIHSVCYHLILAKALTSDAGAQFPERESYLYRALKRGIHHAMFACANLMYHYMAFSLNAAAKLLTSEQALDLINDMVSKFSYESSPINYFISRKALILSMVNMVKSEKLPLMELRSVLSSALKPITTSCFSEDTVMQDIWTLPDTELRCIELKKLTLLCLKTLTNIPWAETLSFWELGIFRTKNPLVILEYTKFVRENGTKKEVEEAYKKAIKHLEDLKEIPLFYTYGARRSIMLLQNTLLEHVAVNGGDLDLLGQLSTITQMQSKMTQEYHEEYFLDCYPLTDNHLLIPQMHYGIQSPAQMPMIQTHYANGGAYLPVTQQMEQLSVQQNADEEQPTCTIFLSNLCFKATKRDIAKAFRHQGVEVVAVRMKINPVTRLNYGHASVELPSKEIAMKAIEDLDHIKIVGRATFLCPYRNKQHTNGHTEKPKKKEADVLYLSGIPDKWMNISKLRRLLGEFGHLKTIECNEDERTARIEYIMAEDSVVGITKLEENLGSSVTIRRGFSSTKPAVKRAKKPLPKKTNFNSDVVIDLTGPTVCEVPIKRKVVRSKDTATNVFLPQQLRKQMKQKLDVPKPSTVTQEQEPMESENTNESSDALNGPRQKKMRVEPTSDGFVGPSLTNEDFRKMIAE